MAVIELKNITKSYGSFDALRGVNLTVREGEVTCVLGDNGAGKSTLIKILAGLHQPTSGELLSDDTPTTFTSPRDSLDTGIATVHHPVALVDVDAGNLSGGQRQVVAIARAVYFGARVLILDEPTAALGVKQSGVVLRFVAAARDRGIAVVLVTHNPHHAYLVGDHFTILKLGRQELDEPRENVTLDELTHQLAGGGELEALSHELGR